MDTGAISDGTAPHVYVHVAKAFWDGAWSPAAEAADHGRWNSRRANGMPIRTKKDGSRSVCLKCRITTPASGGWNFKENRRCRCISCFSCFTVPGVYTDFLSFSRRTASENMRTYGNIKKRRTLFASCVFLLSRRCSLCCGHTPRSGLCRRCRAPACLGKRRDRTELRPLQQFRICRTACWRRNTRRAHLRCEA